MSALPASHEELSETVTDSEVLKMAQLFGMVHMVWYGKHPSSLGSGCVSHMKDTKMTKA